VGAVAEFAKPRGTADLGPQVTREWQDIERAFRELALVFGFHEVRTPTFEHTEVFARGVGDTTDIVQKEMYTFADRGGRSVTLRPEGTAGVVRAFVSERWYAEPLPQKYSYVGSIFRYEKPESGRLREHHQYGVEALGSDLPSQDVEVIDLANRFLQDRGVGGAQLLLNSVGCPTCRVRHKELLLEHLRPIAAMLCDDCQSRLERNPLRVLDCKLDRDHPVVKSSPRITGHLCADCADHFARVRAGLDAQGVRYEVDEALVRGLDYYTRTAFEFVEGSLGTTTTILGGGRYNGLVRMLGGPDVPGIGFGGGIERLILARRALGVPAPVPAGPAVYVVGLGVEGALAAMRMAGDLRSHGVAAEVDHVGRSLKAQLKAADRLHARFAVIVGEAELAAGTVVWRDLQSGEQSEVVISDFVTHVLGYIAADTEAGR
jgi:histidyl-tRNA synthetase